MSGPDSYRENQPSCRLPRDLVLIQNIEACFISSKLVVASL